MLKLITAAALTVLPIQCDSNQDGTIDVATATWGYDYATDDVLVPADQDLTGGDRLDVMFDRWSGYPAWGGDASVEHAHQTCLDMGGSPVWHNDGDYRLQCVSVDF